MIAERKHELIHYGIDYPNAIDRFGGNRVLFERLALRFFDDRHYASLLEALEAGDRDEAYREAHSLKGVAGNLSFTHLHKVAGSLAEALLVGDNEAIRLLLPAVGRARSDVLEGLRLLRQK